LDKIPIQNIENAQSEEDRNKPYLFSGFSFIQPPFPHRKISPELKAKFIFVKKGSKLKVEIADEILQDYCEQMAYKGQTWWYISLLLRIRWDIHAFLGPHTKEADTNTFSGISLKKILEKRWKDIESAGEQRIQDASTSIKEASSPHVIVSESKDIQKAVPAGEEH